MQKIVLSFLLLIALQSTAQVNRMIPNSKTPPPNKAKVDPNEYSANYLKEELNLDAFQVAAVKSHLENNQKEVDKVLEVNSHKDEKIEKIKLLHEKLVADISLLLNDEQKQKFDLLQKKNEKKSKKDKKNKDQ